MARKSIKKTAKKIIKLSVLIGIKEAYLLGRNLLGLVYHPFLTLRTIKKERDFSQAILITASILSPLIVALTLTIAVYLASSFLFPLPIQLKQALILLDLIILLISVAIVIYLFYWSFQVIKKNHFYSHV